MEQEARLAMCGPGRCRVWLETEIIIDSSAGTGEDVPSTSEILLQEGWSTFFILPSGWKPGNPLNLTLSRKGA